VLVQKVVPGGAADRAGIHGGNQQAYLGNMPILLGGDLIVSIDGTDINDTTDITGVMSRHQPGETVTVTVYRGKKKLTLKLALTEGREVNT
jgi:S1-C subfamily serine protease